MKKTSKTVVFFGNERLATGVTTNNPILKGLIADQYEIKAVVSTHKPGKSRKSRDLEIAKVASDHNILMLLPNKPSDIIEDLLELKADVAILVAYGKIVPQSVIDLFPGGIVNVHPSLLPLHRGPTPIESVILNGEDRTGVTLMKLSSKMDAGPVYAQATHPLKGTEDKQSLANDLSEIGWAMLHDLLPNILTGKVVALPQDSEKASYDQLLTKGDGIIDWRKPAVLLEREIRAFTNWPKSKTKLAGIEIVITKAHVIDTNMRPGELTIKNKQLLVGTSDRSLSISYLKPSGRSEMSIEAFLANYKRFFV